MGIGISLNITGLTVRFGSPGEDIEIAGALCTLEATTLFALGTVILQLLSDTSILRLLAF